MVSFETGHRPQGAFRSRKSKFEDRKSDAEAPEHEIPEAENGYHPLPSRELVERAAVKRPGQRGNVGRCSSRGGGTWGAFALSANQEEFFGGCVVSSFDLVEVNATGHRPQGF